MIFFKNHNEESLSALIMPLLEKEDIAIRRGKQYIFGWWLYEVKLVFK